MKRWPLVLVGASVFWGLVFGLSKFPPSESELLLRYAAVSKFEAIPIPAGFAAELPFPIPVGILSLITPYIPVDIFWFRAINMILGIVLLALVKRLADKSVGNWLVVLVCTCLWIVWTVMSSVPAVITLLLAAGMILGERTESPKREITQAFLGLWITQTSLSGWIFAVIFLIYKLGKRFDWKILGVGAAIIGWGLLTSVLPYYKQNLARTPIYIEPGLADRVDMRARYEFKLNNFQNVIPLILKRLVYNKPFFAYREIAGKAVAQFAPERFAFPGQTDTTVARNLWSSKGLGWISWWLIPLVAAGFYFWKRIGKELKITIGLFGIWGILGIILGDTNDFLENGSGLVLAALILAAWVAANSKKAVKALVVLMWIIWTVPGFYHFLVHEEIWRDNRPMVQLFMAESGSQYNARQISTILGRTFLYYGWVNRIKPQTFWHGTEVGMKINGVKFDHFDLKDMSLEPGIYTGLPGEFLGNRIKDNKNDFKAEELPRNLRLLNSYHTRDTVSFGNGDYIWTVKVN